jgi:hypothetical protein
MTRSAPVGQARGAQAATARCNRYSRSGWPVAEADRMRTALLAAVSHDMRTPLADAPQTWFRRPDGQSQGVTWHGLRRLQRETRHGHVA